MIRFGTTTTGKPQKTSLLSTFWGRLARRGVPAGLYEKSQYGLWAESLNPLRGISERQLQDIFDLSRRGIYARLAYIYHEIEAADPLLLTVAERREAAIGACDWKIVPVSDKRTAGFDKSLAEDQAATLELAYGSVNDELDSLAEHLGSGFFRGFAHARPVFEMGKLATFELYDAWNFAYDKAAQEWWWNPDATDLPNSNFTPIPPGELITLTPRRHIDYPALAIYIRAALGERRYGEWLERYGIPPVTIIMPEFAEKGEEQKYFDAADRMGRAGGGTLPHGSQVNYATEARGTNPFLEFLRHQQELITIMATGGTLGTLASPTGIGSGASDIQDKVWRGIVRRDVRSAGRAINRVLTPQLLAHEFPGKPILAHFEFDAEETPSAKQVFEEAGLAKAAGYLIDKAQLEKATGYTLAPAPTEPPTSYPWTSASNKATPPPLQSVAKAPANVAKNLDGSADNSGADAPDTPLRASNADPVNAALKVIEAGGTPEAALAAYDAAAAALLTPGHIATRAEHIAAEMEAAIADVFGAANTVIANAGTSEGARKGWETRCRNGWTPEQLAENKQKVGDLAKEALADKQSNRTISLGKIEGEVIDDIKAATGIDVSGYEQTISSKDIRHTDNRHGKAEKAAGQKPVAQDDYSRIPDILSSYDNITKGTPEHGTNNPSIRYTKKFPDGTITLVEVIAEKEERTLRYKTAWKKEPS